MLLKPLIQIRNSLKTQSIPSCKECSHCLVHWDQQDKRRKYSCSLVLKDNVDNMGTTKFASTEEVRNGQICGYEGRLFTKRNYLSHGKYFKDMILTSRHYHSTILYAKNTIYIIVFVCIGIYIYSLLCFIWCIILL